MSKLEDPVVTKLILDETIKSAVDDIADIIDVFATRIDERLDRLEERMDRIERSLDTLTRTIDGFIKRLDQVETEQLARDAEVQRLKGWIEQIAKETGVKLEGFTK